MRSYEEYIDNPIPRTGRARGSFIANRLEVVYRKLHRDKRTELTLTEFRRVLDTVADKFWDKVYAGYQVSVPFLCSFEVVPSETMFTKSVDWKRTHNLWKQDEEAYDDRLLVRNKPLRHYLKIRHSTISYDKRHWFLSLMLKIRPSKQRVKDIQEKYELR